jgi:hypothetical protein
MSAKSPIDGMLYAITAVVRTPMATERSHSKIERNLSKAEAQQIQNSHK